MRMPLVVWCGRFTSNDGYGAAARANIKSLRAAGVRNVAIDIDSLAPFGELDDGLVRIDRRGDVLQIETIDARLPAVVVTHERPDRFTSVTSRGRVRRVGCSYFEAATLPNGWASALLAMDEVWTASKVNQEAFIDAGVPDWMVDTIPIPLDVDPELTTSDRDQRWGDRTVFLTVLSGLQRRDLRVLYEAFAHAFESTDAVVLVIKVRPGSAEQVSAALASVMEASPARPGGSWPAVEIVEADLTREQLLRFQASADVYVNIERGDGWCLPAFESIGLQRPVIGFDWGGSSDFLDPTDCYVVPVSEHLVYGVDGVPRKNPFYNGHLWPNVDPLRLGQAMRDAAADPSERRRRGEAAAARVRSTMDIGAVGKLYAAKLAGYESHDFRGNQPAVVEVSATGSRWATGRGHRTSERLETELIGRLSNPDLRLLTPPRRFIDAYRDVTRFTMTHRAEIDSRSPIVEAANTALRTPATRPLSKLRALGRMRAAASKGAAAMAGTPFPVELAATMADYRNCVAGANSEFDADTAATRRQTAWGRFGGVETQGTDRKRLADLAGRHHGERVFILGNGPSLNAMDLNLLADEYTFGVNKIYLKFPELTWRPTFYTLLDWRMGPAVADDLGATEGMTRFYPERFRGILPITDDTYWYSPRPVADHFADQFATDASDGIPSRGTVLITAIQLAFHLGFRDIVLVGVDASYTIPSTVVQSGPDQFGTGTRLHLESTADDDPNHFHPGYFGAGAKWHDPNVDEMKRMFRTMRKGVERFGGQLRNATVGGNLECLERVDYRDLFSEA